LNPIVYIGSKSNELLTIKNGRLVSCCRLPFSPLSMYHL